MQPAGDIDMLTAPTLDDALSIAARRHARLIVIDLDEVSFLGAAGLATLANARDTAHHAGSALCLAGGTRAALRALQISGLDVLFEHHSTVHDALQAASDVPDPM